MDAERLERCRRLLGETDSVLVDRALKALIDELQSVEEIRALERAPYEEDPELAWDVSEPPLPYEGKIPPEVVAKAKRRRRR